MASASDSTLYLYTSLTAGSSHIITATSRLETILKANKIPFRAVDCATDEKARMLWGRRSKGRKLPGLVKFGNVIGDIDQVEEWNEFGELTEQIEAADFAGVNPDAGRTPHPSAKLPLDLKPHISISEPTGEQKSAAAAAAARSSERPGDPAINATLRQLGSAAAAKAAQRHTPAATAAAAAKISKPKASTDKSEEEKSVPDRQDATVSKPQTSTKSTEDGVPASKSPSTLPTQPPESTPAASTDEALAGQASKSLHITHSQPEPLESAEKGGSEATKNVGDSRDRSEETG
ncbi:hypothetical protein DV738_g435, partial [Chaetothyriales sp. CBS 135597]